MNWSLNELEALSRKAARGSGLSWGLAEEAGRATRWLAENGLPAAELLAALLKQHDGQAYADLAPEVGTDPWVARGGRLCPLITGAALSDRADEIGGASGIRLGRCAFPVFLLPFAAAASRSTGAVVRLEWDDVALSVGPGGAFVVGPEAALSASETSAVSVTAATAAPGEALARQGRCEVPASAAETLGSFAHRTYAPATEQSRTAGAGAGLNDND